MTRKLRASAVDAGAPLAAWLAARLGLPVADAARRVADGAVYVDGKRELDGDRRLAAGARITVHEPRAAPSAGWRVVHEEPGIIVVDKPAGLPTIRDRAGGAALEPLVAARYPGARAFHRIDRETSGLVLFARGDGATRLASALAAGALVREYLAVVGGVPETPLTLDAVIGPDPADRRRMKAGVPGGKPARTDVLVMRSGAGRTLIRARLGSGITHQIRVHLAAAGHPVLGDTLYGGAPCDRLALHAARLAWPGTVAESPMPQEIGALVPGGGVIT